MLAVARDQVDAAHIVLSRYQEESLPAEGEDGILDSIELGEGETACPACGHIASEELSECPDCGIHLS